MPEPSSVTPLLASMSVPRTQGEALPGRYCPVRSVWTVTVDGGGEMPLIAASHRLLEVVTKTKVRQESDDQAGTDVMEPTRGTSDPSWFLELTTKTEVAQERDDAALRLDALLGLATKTDVRQERDD